MRLSHPLAKLKWLVLPFGLVGAVAVIVFWLQPQDCMVFITYPAPNLGLVVDQHLTVISTDANGLGRRVGIQPGDVLKKLDDLSSESPAEAKQIVRQKTGVSFVPPVLATQCKNVTSPPVLNLTSFTVNRAGQELVLPQAGQTFSAIKVTPAITNEPPISAGHDGQATVTAVPSGLYYI